MKKKRTAKQIAATKKLVAMNKALAKKKTDNRKVGTSQTKVSRVTKKAPSARLKKRRAKNTRTGYYPNPTKSRARAAKMPADHFIAVVDYLARKIKYYDGAGSFTDTRNKAARFHSKQHATNLGKKVSGLKNGEFVAVFPDKMSAREIWAAVDMKLPYFLKKQAG